MHARHLLPTLAFLVTLPTGSIHAQEPVPKANAIECGPVFRKPGFNSVEDFVTAVQTGKAPWRKLFVPDPNPESARDEDVSELIPDSVTIVRASEDSAIVFARHKQGRTSPLCVVIFLLEKEGKRFHVSDFARKLQRSENNADAGQPQILHLEPRDAVHFYFTIYGGSRKWGFDTDEFYMVKDGRIQPTLTLRNVSAYLSPADPYREFTQSAEVGTSHGSPRVVIHRVWGIEGGRSRKQEFPVAFQWDAQAERFTSANADRVTLREPKLWTGGGLPKPPGE